MADHTADPVTVAVDLAGQAEHGVNSLMWWFTTSQPLAEQVSDIIRNYLKTCQAVTSSEMPGVPEPTPYSPIVL